MSDAGWAVDADQIRTHAANIDALQDRFEAVKAASTHIAQDDAAYGLLCGWISGILETRHVRQDELVAKVQRNYALAAEGLRMTADSYEDADTEAASSMSAIGSRLGQ